MVHSTLLFLSGSDLIIVAVVVILLFGGKKIPEFAKGLGEAMKNFKDASDGKDGHDANANKPSDK